MTTVLVFYPSASVNYCAHVTSSLVPRPGEWVWERDYVTSGLAVFLRKIRYDLRSSDSGVIFPLLQFARETRCEFCSGCEGEPGQVFRSNHSI